MIRRFPGDVIQRPAPEEAPQATEVWQDHWPSIAYSIDYRHDKNPQIDPDKLYDLMVDMEIPEEEIPGLTMILNNDPPLSFTAGSYSYKNKEINLGVRKTDKTVGTAIHELTHFKDDLEGNIDRAAHKRRVYAGIFAGMVASAATLKIDNQWVDPGQIDALPTPAKVAFYGNILARIISGEILGSLAAYRTSPHEIRAFKKEKDAELHEKYDDTLFTSLSD